MASSPFEGLMRAIVGYCSIQLQCRLIRGEAEGLACLAAKQAWCEKELSSACTDPEFQTRHINQRYLRLVLTSCLTHFNQSKDQINCDAAMVHLCETSFRLT